MEKLTGLYFINIFAHFSVDNNEIKYHLYFNYLSFNRKFETMQSNVVPNLNCRFFFLYLFYRYIVSMNLIDKISFIERRVICVYELLRIIEHVVACLIELCTHKFNFNTEIRFAFIIT